MIYVSRRIMMALLGAGFRSSILRWLCFCQGEHFLMGEITAVDKPATSPLNSHRLQYVSYLFLQSFSRASLRMP